MGLHFTPPAVACVAYLGLSDGSPDLVAQALFGYALLHGAVGLRLLPWLRQQSFAAPYWAYTFGLSALPLAALRLVERGQTGPAAMLALPMLIASSATISAIALGTVRLLVQGRLVVRSEMPESVGAPDRSRPGQRGNDGSRG